MIWYWLAIAAFILLVWSCRVFPTQDGATHAYNAIQLRQYLFQTESPARVVYEFNHGLTTNWTAHLLLVPLTAVLPAPAADQALVTLLILFLAGTWYAALRGTPHLLPFAIPLMVNTFLFFGFYSFVFSVGALVAALSSGRWRWLWLQLAWLSHPVCWAVAVAACLADQGRQWRRIALEAAPGAICALAFATQMHGGRIAGPPLFSANLQEFLFGENPFTAVDLVYFSMAMGLMLTLVLTAACRRTGAARWLGASAVACWLLWPITPKATFTGSFVPGRILLLALALTLIWLSRQDWQVRWSGRLAVAGMTLASVLLAAVAWRVWAVQPLYAEFFELRTAGRTLAVRQMLATPGDPVVGGMDIFLHAGAWLMARDGAVDVANYEAGTPHFPLRFGNGFQPGFEGKTETEPPRIQLGNNRPDTIVLWGYREKPAWLEGYTLAQRTAHGMVWRRAQRSME